jgi:hypothetical protein
MRSIVGVVIKIYIFILLMISELDELIRDLHNTLVYKSTNNEGSLWAIYIATVPTGISMKGVEWGDLIF